MHPSLETRLRVAIEAAEGAGAALLRLRERGTRAEERADQLKAAVDLAAEGWVSGYLRAHYPDEAILGEEAFEAQGRWSPAPAFWTVDALDGTRSYIEGYDGFCVQLAYLEQGRVRVGVVYEPVADVCYFAVGGAGAYRRSRGGAPERLHLAPIESWPAGPVFVDSTPPSGAPGAIMQAHRGAFLECGSIGLKICRVADGSADVFLKALTFRLWDAAPGELVLREAGGRLGMWSGEPIDYGTESVLRRDILAAPEGLFERTVRELADASVRGSSG